MAEAYYGEIRIFAGDPRRIPRYWAACNGQLLSISDYADLYSLIGNTYGGDGKSTFALPNIQGRVVMGIGQGSGLSKNWALGQKTGVERVALTGATMPAHTHSLNVTTKPATTNVPSSGRCFGAVDPPLRLYNDDTQKVVMTNNMGPSTTSYAGGGTAHENEMPSLVLNYIICIQGLFPPFPSGEGPGGNSGKELGGAHHE